MDENRIIPDREVDFVDDRTFDAIQKVKKAGETQRLVNKQVIKNTKNLHELEKQVDKAVNDVVKDL